MPQTIYTVNKALDYIHDINEKINAIDQLEPIKSVKAIWEEVPADIIENCCASSGLIYFKDMETEVTSNAITQIERDNQDLDSAVKSLVGMNRKMCIQKRFNTNNLYILKDVVNLEMSGIVTEGIM